MEHALRLAPNDPDAHNDLGLVLRRTGRNGDAQARYNEAVRLNPNHVIARKNRSMMYLLHGDFARGWAEYEYRWKCPEAGGRLFNRPEWDGRQMAGTTILLHCEQGLGDTLQFIRYAPLVKKLWSARSWSPASGPSWGC